MEICRSMLLHKLRRIALAVAGGHRLRCGHPVDRR